MKFRRFAFLLGLIILLATLHFVKPAESVVMTETEKIETFKKFDWKGVGTYKLPLSQSSLALPMGYVAVIGEDAKRSLILSGEPAFNGLEAVVLAINDNIEIDSNINFSYLNLGYISVDDWGSVDPVQLLKVISEKTEEENKERKKMGSEAIHVVGWIQEPTLDRQTHTVYWAIDAEYESGDRSVNSVALRLGRKGVEHINWVTSKSSYKPFGGDLDVMLRAHSFDPGFRYKDYTTGDKVANYGIASLVGLLIGSKVVKAGWLMLLLKKAGVFIVAAIAAILYKLKNLFKRNTGN